MFAYKPPVTKEQFFAPGFGERKVIMSTQIIQLMRIKHQSLAGSNKPVSTKLRPTQTQSLQHPVSANPLAAAATCEVS
jgi:Centrosomal spindle body, CEP44